MEIKDYADNELRRKLENISEDDIVVFDHVDNLPQNENIRTEFYIVLMCLDGKASCRLGDRTFELHKNDMFFCHPQQFLENAMASLDFRCQGLVVSPSYLENIFLLGGNMWNARRAITDTPVIHLSEEEMALAVTNNNFIRDKLNAPRLPHTKEMLRLLFQSLVYEFYDMLVSKLPFVPSSYTSAETLFSHFMDLAIAETPRRREVKYYADRLCVTAKYLSAVCKQQSGSTASAIINRLSLDHIKRELRCTDKSVKEIAAEAGFDNLSFFGKYVRRELGMSPRDYRKADNENVIAKP